MNKMNYLERYGAKIREINLANGWEVLNPEDWDDPYRVPASLSLLHSEVSEALEGFRNHDKENFDEELADIFIRLLDLSHNMDVDLESEINKKLLKNAKRGYKHDGKKI